MSKTKEQNLLEMYYKRIGQKLKEAREENELTQTKLANYLEVTPGSIANYENGIRQIPVHLLVSASGILRKPLHYFLGSQLEPNFVLKQNLIKAVENFTDGEYIDICYELDTNNKIIDIEKGLFDLLPVPKNMFDDVDFAVKYKNDQDNCINYYLCEYYNPHIQKTGFIFKTNHFINKPKENNLVIVSENYPNNSNCNFELKYFKDVKPCKENNIKLGKNEDPRLIGLFAIVVGKIERLAE